jgi:hypothetical protein
LAKSGRINGLIRLLTMAKIWSAGSGNDDLMSPASSRWPDVARFRGQLDFDDRLLPDSGNLLSNVREEMKNLISKNDLRFCFLKIK